MAQRKISFEELVQIPETERTLNVCIAGMRWALETKDRSIVLQMLKHFPADILLQCFVHSNIGYFEPNYQGPV